MACCPTASAPARSATPDAIASAKVHLHLHTADLARSIAFYRILFDADPVKQKHDYAKFLPTWAPINLALSPAANADRGNAIGHVGVQLPTREAVREHRDRLRAAGLVQREETGVVCCYAEQDKFWLMDPNGVEWEIYHLNADVDAMPSAQPAASACCPR